MLKVEVKPMSNLTKKTREIICQCDIPCDTYVHLEDYGRFCKGATLDFAYNLITLLKGGVAKPSKAPNKDVWTVQEILFIKQWYSNGIRYGDRKLIAKALGRSEASVYSKIQHMQREGLL